VQPGGPPIWLGGRRPPAIRRAGRFADVWMPYMYTPEQVARSLAEVRDAAEQAGRDPSSVQGAVFCWGAVHEDPATARADAVDTVSAVYQQDFGPLADRYLLHGDPDRVTARVREYADAGAGDRLIDVAAFKDLARVSRKYAIPLLEYFDRERVTRRAGDRRLIL
jgi:alkanesulfonate monooxygenase SsuD/methylene tetrahydromethanopterin reductase-like flavin-dependent oxidoreductase (luciferase family)